MSMQQRRSALMSGLVFSAMLINSAFAFAGMDEVPSFKFDNVGVVTVSATPGLINPANDHDFSDPSNKELDEERAGAILTPAYFAMLAAAARASEANAARLAAAAQAKAANLAALNAIWKVNPLLGTTIPGTHVVQLAPATIALLTVVPRGNPNYVYTLPRR